MTTDKISTDSHKSMHAKIIDNELIPLVLDFADKEIFNTGDSILDPETDSASFYYVMTGAVEVNYTHQAGTKITVALIGKENFFGEIGYFDGESRVRDIQAADAVQIAIFTPLVMRNIQLQAPQLYADFLLFLIKRICSKFRKIVDDRKPISSYAASLSSSRVPRYSDAMLLPQDLVSSINWREVTEAVEEIKTELFDLAHRLQRYDTAGMVVKETETRCVQVLENFGAVLPKLHRTMENTGHEDHAWGYIFKEIYPYFMRSRFAERSYFKPKGYAGDFLMMEHIYNNKPAGDGKFGEIIDAFCLDRQGSHAVRGRRILLRDQLAALSRPLAEAGKKINIMNLACGSNRELFDFLQQCEYSSAIDALCVDIDADALQYTNSQVNIFPHGASVRLMRENVIKWSLGRTQQEFPKQDIIYSAGLCDYLNRRLFRSLIKQCHNRLKPGGFLILGNFTWYPDVLFSSKFLKWELIYRTEDDLLKLFDGMPFNSVKILTEKNNINLFVLAQKD